MRSSSSCNESFFCQDREPPIPYTIRPCGQCELCCISYYNRDRPPSPVHFRSFDKFTFLNGYETILNANAVRILFTLTILFLFVFTSHVELQMLSMSFDVHAMHMNMWVKLMFHFDGVF